MSLSEKPFLGLLDAFPGAGKTHMFRKIVFDAMSLLSSDNSPGFVYVYVAPTKVLCEEVYNTLLHQLREYFAAFPGQGGLTADTVHSRLHKIWVGADSSITSASQTLNEALGTLKPTSSKKALRPHNVIFTTHEAFVRVKNTPTAFPTWVFFDEARQCLGVKETIRLPVSEAPQILKAFSPVEIKPTTLQLEETELERTHRKVFRLSAPKNWNLKVDVSSSSSTCTLQAISSLKKLLANTESGRSSLYILAPDAAIDPKIPNSGATKAISIFPFQNPEGLFQNYSRVTIMSAFFRDSQMYHSLRKHYNIVDLLRPPVDVELPRWIRDSVAFVRHGSHTPRSRDHLLQLHTGTRLKIVPLLVSESDTDELSAEQRKNILSIDLNEVSSKDRLSKNTLTSGLIVSPQVQAEVVRYVNENNLPLTSRSTIEAVWLHWYGLQSNSAVRKAIEIHWKKTFNCEYGEHVPKLYRMLKPFMFDAKSKQPLFPAWVLTRQANNLFKKIQASIGSGDKPLLVYNASSRSVPYSPISTHTLRKVGLPTDTAPVADTQEFLRKRFGKMFHIPQTPRLNGLNKWQDNDHFIHLAALNPPPDVVLLLKHVLPKYDAVYDFMLENLVQTLYRTSLRNPNRPETSPVFLYTTKSAIGRLLSQKLKLQFEIFNFHEHDVQRQELVELDFVSDSFNKHRSIKRALSKRKYDPNTAVEVRRLQTAMRRYALLEKRGESLTPKQAEKLKELRSALAELQGL